MMPVAGYLVDTQPEALTEKKYANTLVCCARCGLVQQGGEDFTDVLIQKVYANYQATYSMSAKVRAYMTRFIDEALASSALTVNTDIVLEVGSNDGTMFGWIQDKGFIPAGIDPSAEVSRADGGAIVVRDFFSTAVAGDFVRKHGQVKLLFSRHTLEHVFSPGDFMNAVSIVLDKQGIAVIEVPYLPAQLNGNQYPGMTFQHISFFTLHSLKGLGEMYGLSIFKVKPSRMDGGSVVVYFSKNPKNAVTPARLGFLEYETAVLANDYHGLQRAFKSVDVSLRVARSHIIGLCENSFRVIAYGAGSKGQALLNMLGLSADIIPTVVDETPGLKGKYIVGTGTRVVDSSDECFLEANFCLISAPTHVDEIVSKEQSRHPGTAFIKTSPDFSYISDL